LRFRFGVGHMTTPFRLPRKPRTSLTTRDRQANRAHGRMQNQTVSARQVACAADAQMHAPHANGWTVVRIDARGKSEKTDYSGLRRAPSAWRQDGGWKRSELDVVPVRRCSKVDYCYCPRHQLLITEDMAF
jgi:hypothetical protein